MLCGLLTPSARAAFCGVRGAGTDRGDPAHGEVQRGGHARERERGNLEMLINAPVRPVELMVGKVLPCVFIGLVQVTLIMLLGMLTGELGRC